MNATLTYHGISHSRDEGPEFLVPALGYRSVRGIAKALLYAVRYDLEKRGSPSVKIFEGMAFVDLVEEFLIKSKVDPTISNPGCYHMFTLTHKKEG